MMAYEFDQDFDHILGNEDAISTIVAYESLTCPHCRKFMDTAFLKLQTEWVVPEKLRFVLREVYFDQAGLMAGAMLRAVPEARYFEAVEALYDQQDAWLAGEILPEVADHLLILGDFFGADKDQIQANMHDENLNRKLIEHSQRHINKDEVQGTPTLILNGEKLTDWSYPSLKKALENENF